MQTKLVQKFGHKIALLFIGIILCGVPMWLAFSFLMRPNAPKIETLPPIEIQEKPAKKKADFEELAPNKLAAILGSELDVRQPVPRNFQQRLPEELTTVKNVRLKKRMFTVTLLPVVLRANEIITAERARVIRLQKRAETGRSLTAIDRDWVNKKLRKLRVPSNQRDLTQPSTYDALLNRLDIIPPSLALSQAALETGWGTSYFSQEGNALFGEWVWGDETGILPRARDENKTHRIKSFDYLLDSVLSYMTNLNRHATYDDLRKRRSELRKHNLPVTGSSLAPALVHYSERGESYVTDILSIIRFNGLSALDSSQLTAS